MSTRLLAALGLLCAAACHTPAAPDAAPDEAPPARFPDGSGAGPLASAPAWEDALRELPARPPSGPGAATLEPALAMWTPRAPAPAPPERSAPRAAPEERRSVGVADPAEQASTAWIVAGWMRRLRSGQDPFEGDEEDEEALLSAKRLLDDRIARPYLEDGRRRLGRGDPESALVVADGGLALVSDHGELLWLAAECGLRIAARTGDRAVLDEARTRLERLGDRPEAWLGRSRAARLVRDPETAVRDARRALEQLDAGAATELDRGFAAEAPERTLAEAQWLAYRLADPVASDGTSGREALAERERLERDTEAALSRLARSLPDDPWPWRRLTELRLELGRASDALNAVHSGLVRHRWDAELIHLLEPAARRVGGGDRVLREYRALRDRTPNAPLGFWYPGEEFLGRALDDFAGRGDREVIDRDLIQDFDRTATWFRRCRSLSNRAGEAALARACAEREATTLVARGWMYTEAHDALRARQMFDAAEVLRPGILIERPVDALAPASDALVLLAEADAAAGRDEVACGEYEELRRLDPTSLPWARRTAELQQRRASELEKRADQAERAARGELPGGSRLLADLRREAGVRAKHLGRGGERRRLERYALVLRQDARECYGVAWRALSDACELAPGDARLLVDAARIDVQVLRADDVRSEGRLRRAIALVTDRLEASDLDAEARFDLQRAQGDAYQALGTLYHERYDDPVTALEYLDAAVRIGPTPRRLIEDTLLPRVREAAAARGASSPADPR